MSLSISELSARYTVRRLTEADIPAILNVMEGNPLFYRYCGAGAAPSAALIRQDMTALPPGKTMPDKYYLGFFQGDRLAAVMDLIDGYPTPDIAFIGFFMTNSALQGQGEGTRIISELSAARYIVPAFLPFSWALTRATPNPPTSGKRTALPYCGRSRKAAVSFCWPSGPCNNRVGG